MPAAVMKTERHVLASKPPRVNAQQAASTSGKVALLLLRISNTMGLLSNDLTSRYEKMLLLLPNFVSWILLAPAANEENKISEREETVSAPAVVDKRQPVVSSSHIPTTRSTPPVNQLVNKPASPRPPPDQTGEEDNDYDSDDASKADLNQTYRT